MNYKKVFIVIAMVVFSTVISGCGGGNGDDVVVFSDPDEPITKTSDPGLYECARWSMPLSPDSVFEELPLEQVQSLEELHCQQVSLRNENLAKLKQFTSLKVLGLTFTDLVDISGLNELDYLEKIYLDHNHLTDLSPLAHLTSLVEISVNNNQITHVSSLNSLNVLENLYLQGNKINDVGFLSNAPVLKKAYLGGNAISDLTPLVGLPSLEILNVYGIIFLIFLVCLL